MSNYTAVHQLVESYSALLARLTSADNSVRNDAEATLKQLEVTNLSHSLTLELISTAQEGKENPVPIRQLAAILLRKYAKEQGTGTSLGEQPYTSDEPEVSMSAEAKPELLLSLSGSDAKTRETNAYVVAALIKQKWRTMLERVFDDIITMMKSTTENDAILSNLKIVAAVFERSVYDNGH